VDACSNGGRDSPIVPRKSDAKYAPFDHLQRCFIPCDGVALFSRSQVTTSRLVIAAVGDGVTHTHSRVSVSRWSPEAINARAKEGRDQTFKALGRLPQSSGIKTS